MSIAFDTVKTYSFILLVVVLNFNKHLLFFYIYNNNKAV